MASRKKMMGTAIAVVETEPEYQTPPLLSRARRRKQTVKAHNQRLSAANHQLRRVVLYMMRERRRLEPRPDSQPMRQHRPSRIGHPKKQLASRSGRRY